jgi:MFS family permease
MGYTIPTVVAANMGIFIDFMGLMAIIPLLPSFVESTGNDLIWVGVILSTQYGAMVVGSMLFGYLCDIFGPKSMMILTLGVDTVVFALTGIVEDIYVMLVVRFIAGMSSPTPVGTAWIGIGIPPAQQPRAFQMQVIMVLTGSVLGTGLGSLFPNLRDAAFVTAALAGVACLVIVVGSTAPKQEMRKDANGKALERAKPEGVRKVLRSIQFAGAASVVLDCGQLGGFSLAVLGVLFKTKWGYDEQQVGLVYFALMGGILIGNLAIVGPATRAVPEPHKRIGVFGLGTLFWILVQCAIMLTADDLPHADALLLAAHITMWCFGALAFPTSMLLASAAADRFGSNCQGSVMGVHTCLVSVGQSLGPIIGVFIWSELGDVYIFPYLAVCNMLVLTLIWYIYFYIEGPSAKKNSHGFLAGANAVVPSTPDDTVVPEESGKKT